MNFAKHWSVAIACAISLSTGLSHPARADQSEFALNLFQHISKEHSKDNIVISPTSVSLALTMAFVGASGSTRTAMAKALGIAPDATNDQVLAKLKATMASLKAPRKKVEINVANALFANKSVPLKPAFVQTIQQKCDGEVSSMDFASPATVAFINQWVATKTKGKIRDLLSILDPSAKLVLVNAIYFNGKWSHMFEKSATQPGPFTCADGKKVTVPMMTKTGDFEYTENPEMQAVMLPYADGALSMIVVLPRKGKSLPELESQLTAEKWKTWMAALSSQEGTLQMPRFKIGDKFELKGQLSQMGMGEAFTGQADFSGMATGKTMIGAVLHEATMEVDEQGTVAAAATAVVALPGGVGMSPKLFEMTCNRPFMLAIRDNISGHLLFVGQVANPAKK